MTLFLLLVAPMFLVAPGVFMDRSSTPKMLSIVAGLVLLLHADRHLVLRRVASARREAVVFLAVCLLSALFAADRWTAFSGAQRAPYYGLFPLLLVFLAYIGSTELDEREVDEAIVAGGVLLAGFSIVQAIVGRSLTGMPMPEGRSIGFRGSPVMLAASLTPCFLAAYHRARKLMPFRIFSEDYIAAAIILAGLLAAKAKGAVLALAAGVWVYEVAGPWRWIGLVGAVSLSWNAIQHSNAEQERFELVRIAWKSFKQHPVLGWGPDCFFHALMKNRGASYDSVSGAQNAQASAHNIFAQVLATMGLPGLLAFLAGLWRLIRAGYSDNLALAVLCATLVQAQVNPVPTDILVMVAVILGCRQRDSEGLVRIPGWIAPAVAGAALVLAINDLTPFARSWP